MAESSEPAMAEPLRSTPETVERLAANGPVETCAESSSTSPLSSADSAVDGESKVESPPIVQLAESEPVAATAAPVSDASSLRECVTEAERRIVQLFEKKLSFDQFKEQQIERLHAELQEYKRGFAESILLPLVKQVVRYVDQIPRHLAALKKKPAEELGPERLFRELEGVRADLELILENIGVTLFHSTAVEFDVKVQQARSAEVGGDPAQHGRIVERVLPGYELNGRVIEKERVKVYVYQQGGPVSSEQAGEGR